MKHVINSDKELINEVIERYIVGFKAYRNREILKLRYLDGRTYEEIAEICDMSVRHIKRVCYDNEPIIIKHLKAEVK